jgi:hypothetical protein
MIFQGRKLPFKMQVSSHYSGATTSPKGVHGENHSHSNAGINVKDNLLNGLCPDGERHLQ